jgi:iron complex outermembrane receptor protein
MQTQVFTFEALGDEAFMPASENQVASIFTFQEMSFDQHTLSAGARMENSVIEKQSSANFGASDEFGFTGLNGSAGYRYQLHKEHSVSFNYSYTERAPSFQELLSNGDHVATGTREIGDSGLTKEKAHAFELGWKKVSDFSTWSLSTYAQRFEDYIALTPTGAPVVTLPEYEYRQTNAVFYGLDLDGKQKLVQTEKGLFNALAKFDFVRAKDTKTGNNIPRISPPRASAGVEYVRDRFTSDLEAQYVFEQTKTAPGEERSGRYILTNFGTTYSFIQERSRLELFFRVRNIFDVEARSHVSTLKNIAPMPGRNLILGAQILI